MVAESHRHRCAEIAPDGLAACSCALTSCRTSAGTSAVATELSATCPPAGTSMADTAKISWADASPCWLVSLSWSLWTSSHHHRSDVRSVVDPLQQRRNCLCARIASHVTPLNDASHMTSTSMCDVTACSAYAAFDGRSHLLAPRHRMRKSLALINLDRSRTHQCR